MARRITRMSAAQATALIVNSVESVPTSQSVSATSSPGSSPVTRPGTTAPQAGTSTSSNTTYTPSHQAEVGGQATPEPQGTPPQSGSAEPPSGQRRIFGPSHSAPPALAITPTGISGRNFTPGISERDRVLKNIDNKIENLSNDLKKLSQTVGQLDSLKETIKAAQDFMKSAQDNNLGTRHRLTGRSRVTVPRSLSDVARRLHHNMDQKFDGSQKLVGANLVVQGTLVDQLSLKCGDKFCIEEIKMASYRVFDNCRRKAKLRGMSPSLQDKKRKDVRETSARHRLYRKRATACQTDFERSYWEGVPVECMSDEEAHENEEGCRFYQVRKIVWRHEDLNEFVASLDRKLACDNTRINFPRIPGTPSSRMPSPRCPTRYIKDEYVPDHSAGVLDMNM